MILNSRLSGGIAVALSVGACNALLGVDDVYLKDDGANGGMAGAGATSAQAGTSGAAGKVNHAGGDSAHGGEVAEAGSSATAGSGGESGGSAQAGGAGMANLGGESGSGGAPDSAGAAGAGGVAGAGGEGGEGGAPVEPTCPLPDQTVGGGKLQLVQFVPIVGTRGRLAVSKNGKNAYITTWGSITQHFVRDPATGKLTAQSSTGIYNGEYVMLSPDDKHLYAGGVNSPQFYDIQLGSDGAIAKSTVSVPSGYASSVDAMSFGDSAIFLASHTSIRAIVNGVYDATNRAPATYDGVRTLSRGGDYLYWTEYAVPAWFPDKTPKVARAKVNCDGSLQQREAFATTPGPLAVAVCTQTQLAYVGHAAEKVPDKPGFIDVIDLAACGADFSACVPVKTLTNKDIAGLADVTGISIAPDCSALYVTNLAAGAGELFNLSLSDPKSPVIQQTFAAEGTYDGVTLGDIWGWHMGWFDGFLYLPTEFGKGIAVFKSGK